VSWDNAYLALNFSVVPAWALLVFLPRAGVTKAVVHSGLYPVALGLVYVASLGAAMFFGQSAPDAQMGSLGGVMALFSHPNGIITGWTHYLVFDLFVGAWIARDAQRRNVPHLATVPCMLLTFLFGPVGLLLYMLLRLALGKGLSLVEPTSSSTSSAA
jgi:hypothetical protein